MGTRSIFASALCLLSPSDAFRVVTTPGSLGEDVTGQTQAGWIDVGERCKMAEHCISGLCVQRFCVADSTQEPTPKQKPTKAPNVPIEPDLIPKCDTSEFQQVSGAKGVGKCSGCLIPMNDGHGLPMCYYRGDEHALAACQEEEGMTWCGDTEPTEAPATPEPSTEAPATPEPSTEAPATPEPSTEAATKGKGGKGGKGAGGKEPTPKQKPTKEPNVPIDPDLIPKCDTSEFQQASGAKGVGKCSGCLIPMNDGHGLPMCYYRGDEHALAACQEEEGMTWCGDTEPTEAN